MANHKSAEKRARQTKVRTLRNKTKTTATRGVIKKIRAAIEESDKANATSLLVTAQKMLDRLAKTGVIKANAAARKTSRLALQINKL